MFIWEKQISQIYIKAQKKINSFGIIFHMKDEEMPLKYLHSSNHRIIASTWNTVESNVFIWFLNSVYKRHQSSTEHMHYDKDFKAFTYFIIWFGDFHQWSNIRWTGILKKTCLLWR